ncbi:glycosyltransferase [Lachnoclostridium sp. Marseille-P6806]|uniref:glycosyltransferase n=1 Tax=Lachnoclostridium sp. Marseille-P6806 TaxID=2364793 RepID=UPI0010319E6D|nr:glycosyltransferase [Lachnoclostridium sp. Marseille-P6806]
MRIQVLVAAVEENVVMLSEHMNLSTEAIICNQCREYSYQEYVHRGRKVRAFSFAERGVGLNRNNALMRADTELCAFADEDIVYDDDYEEKILREFERNPQADVLMFNVQATEHRRTYENIRHKRVRWYNYGRYPTYSMCARVDRLHRANVSFSLLFGGGAKYSNGEDSLFIHDCLKKGLRIYAVPVSIGHERKRSEDEESTWFKGYNEKFFYDRGVLYHFLYGVMARPFALLFLLRKRRRMCREIPLLSCYRLMKKGIREQ